MQKLILALAAVLGVAGPASGQFKNTQDAYVLCQASERLRVSGGVPTDRDVTDDLVCVGYLKGLADGTMNSLRIEDRGEVYLYIAKGEPTALQVLLVFQRYVREHPELLNKPAADTMLAALVGSGLMSRTRWPDPQPGSPICQKCQASPAKP